MPWYPLYLWALGSGNLQFEAVSIVILLAANILWLGPKAQELVEFYVKSLGHPFWYSYMDVLRLPLKSFILTIFLFLSKVIHYYRTDWKNLIIIKSSVVSSLSFYA